MDPIGYYIATLHGLLGHDKAAAVVGEPPYNKNTCILCLYERGKASQDEVVAAIGVSRG